MTRRIETQIAIRLKQSSGYRYEQYRDNGPGGAVSLTKLNAETAKTQLSLYTASSEPTIMTREVLIDEGEWEKLEVNEVRVLAELLHKKQCHANHTDQCGWGYEPDWNGYTHKQYANKAEAILERTNFKTAKELLELL